MLDTKVMEQMKEHVAFVNTKAVQRGVTRVVTCLQGSQNYQLADEYSDVDTKSLVVPSFRTLVFSSDPVSSTEVLPNDAHADMKDLRLMFGCFRKQNVNFLEVLFTPYFDCDPAFAETWKLLQENKELLAHYNEYLAVSCMLGMTYEKYHAFEHKYPAALAKLEKFGYDPKQLHHMLRMQEFLTRYTNGVPFKECLVSENSEYLLAVKRGLYPYDAAVKVKEVCMKEVEAYAVAWKSTRKSTVNETANRLLNDVQYDVFEKSVRKELL